MPSADALDAVTVDAFGTLVVLEDPAERLRLELAARGVERDVGAVRRAFGGVAAYTRPRSVRGRDATSLAVLRQECVSVFLTEADAALDAAEFVPAFVGSIVFSLAEGTREALDALRAAGLSLACAANWDVSLHDHLARLGIADRFDAVLASADVGVEKPDPRVFAHALERLGVVPGRALHIGDEEVDRVGAAAAGLAFEPVPLATLPARLGL